MRCGRARSTATTWSRSTSATCVTSSASPASCTPCAGPATRCTPRRSLRLRLALFGAGFVALALLVFGVLLYALLSRGVGTNQDDALRSRAQQAVRSLNASSQPVAQPPVAPADLRSSTEIFVEVFDQAWTVLYSTVEPTMSPAARRGGFVTQGGFRLYAAPFDDGYVVAGQSVKVPQSSLSGIVVFLVVSAVPALIAALLASWLVAGRGRRPPEAVGGGAGEDRRGKGFWRGAPGRRRKEGRAGGGGGV